MRLHGGVRMALLGLACVAAPGGPALAQYYYPSGYGYGGYGFGGWGGGTVEGSVLQGMGAYAQGAGVYNYDTAVATSIDTDTAIRLNQYLYSSAMESKRQYNLHRAAQRREDISRYEARMAKVRDNPSKEDIYSGDALNVLVDQMTAPSVVSGSGATLRMANAPISGAAIREIPFRDDTDAITFSLDQLTDQTAWPEPLRGDAFKAEREAYQKAVDDALAEDWEGSLSPATVAKVRNAVSQLYNKVENTIPKTKQPDHLQAINYLKGLAGLSRMLEKPNVDQVLGELEKVKETTVGHLIAFMHTYNLRFAPAQTPKQRAIYADLYPLMVGQRDKILGKPADPSAPQPKLDNPTALFHGFDPAHLNAPGQPTNPPPPAPAPSTTPSPAPGTAPNASQAPSTAPTTGGPAPDSPKDSPIPGPNPRTPSGQPGNAAPPTTSPADAVPKGNPFSP